MDSQKNAPNVSNEPLSHLEASEKSLAAGLRALADETHLRPEFKHNLQSELSKAARQQPERPAEKAPRRLVPGWVLSAAAMAGLLLILAVALLALPRGGPAPAAEATPSPAANATASPAAETPTATPGAASPTPQSEAQTPLLQQNGLLMPPAAETCNQWADTIGQIFGARAEQSLAPTHIAAQHEFGEQEGMGCLIEVALPGMDVADVEEPLRWLDSLLAEDGLTAQGERLEPAQPFDPAFLGDWFGNVQFYRGGSAWAVLTASWIPEENHPCRPTADTACEVLPEDRVTHLRLLLADSSLQDFFIALANDDPAAFDALTPELRAGYPDLAALQKATGMDKLLHPVSLVVGSVFEWFNEPEQTASVEVRLRDLLSSQFQPMARLSLQAVYQGGRWTVANFTRLEDALPEPEPTGTPLPIRNPPDINPQTVEPVTYPSADGRWLAEVWTVYPDQLAPDQRQAGFNFLRMVVRATDGTAEFTILEQWEPEGLGAPQPAEFLWTENALYFTWQSVPDGCGGFDFDHWLYRVDLETGNTELIDLPHDGDLSVSPDGAYAAYLLNNSLGVYDLETRESIVSMELPPELGFDTPYQAIGGMVWSPDQRQVLLSAWAHACGAVFEPTQVWLLDLETQEWVEIVPAGEIHYQVAGWPEPQRIELTDQDQQAWVLDPTTGELRRAED
ncbi:MAG TPA: hypothetical protein VFF68_00340 [Anaerolineaceae bacterium]|nr:hypothetical protein [Anaerolineaceae bacterium]